MITRREKKEMFFFCTSCWKRHILHRGEVKWEWESQMKIKQTYDSPYFRVSAGVSTWLHKFYGKTLRKENSDDKFLHNF